MSFQPDPERKVADQIEGVQHPAENQRLFGHEEPLKHLYTQYHSGRMHHAWLLCGPRGIGKATLAFRFAAHVLRNPQAASAGLDLQTSAMNDPVAARIAAGSHPNLLHLTRPWDFKTNKFKTQLTVDEVRLTVPFFGTSRGEKGWRIAIVDAADDMNRNASNALLKILEEPPDDTLFFIIAHSAASISATIRSRCQTLALKALDETVVLTVLEQSSVLDKIDEGDRALLARLANGSPRRAMVLAGNDGLDLYRRFMAACDDHANPDWPEIHALADSVCRRGREDRYRILLDMAGEFLEGVATGTGNGQPKLSRLARWAGVWEKTRHSANLAERFNLDRKQVILNLFHAMEEVA